MVWFVVAAYKTTSPSKGRHLLTSEARQAAIVPKTLPRAQQPPSRSPTLPGWPHSKRRSASHASSDPEAEARRSGCAAETLVNAIRDHASTLSSQRCQGDLYEETDVGALRGVGASRGGDGVLWRCQEDLYEETDVGALRGVGASRGGDGEH